MKSYCVLLIALMQIVVLMCGQISFAGTWRDDFEDRITREWKIYNLDRQVENWWVNKGEAVGRIFKRGFMSLWLTGELDWENYSVSCRGKLVKERNDPAYIGLTLHDRGEEDTRYLFFINFFFGTVSIIKASPRNWSTRTFPFVSDIDTWYHLKATVNDGQLEFQVNGQVFVSEDSSPLKSGQAGLVVGNAEGRFDDVAITGVNIKNGGPGRARAVDRQEALTTTWGRIKQDR
ncbi:hypothetical protein C6502_03630 [Candidatus Poribacteria bacterium]|nr:MAG: hypothetical protein C6502_03630 [Candidatus Poribacteria bacterium]